MEKRSADIMTDLETCGTSAGCAILSIGAVTFDEEYKFYDKISLNSCINAGLITDPGTMAWWDKQSREARDEAFSGTRELTSVLGEFSEWYRGVSNKYGKSFIWGNGADFDIPILQEAYIAVGMPHPWARCSARCYRTLKNLPYFKEVSADRREGTHHNALDDAIFQARHAVKILRFHKERNSI